MKLSDKKVKFKMIFRKWKLSERESENVIKKWKWISDKESESGNDVTTK